MSNEISSGVLFLLWALLFNMVGVIFIRGSYQYLTDMPFTRELCEVYEGFALSVGGMAGASVLLGTGLGYWLESVPTFAIFAILASYCFGVLLRFNHWRDRDAFDIDRFMTHTIRWMYDRLAQLRAR